MYLYNPETFDPLAILPAGLAKFADDARYFVHKLYVNRVFNKRHKDKFIPLKAEYLRKVMSERKYTAIRNALIQSGVILTDHYWIRGKKAIGYMLGPQFNGVRHKKVKITNRRLLKNIGITEGPSICESKLDTHVHLRKYLSEIEIDYDKAVLSIQEDFYMHELAISMIRDQQWFFVADKYGRVHTNITNLKSSLRRCLRWHKQKLVNTDICNSQPLFLGVLLIDYYSNKGSLSSSFFNLSSPPYPLRCDILPADVLLFERLVENGEIYEHIAEQAGVNANNRKKFKRRLFAEVFFCRNGHRDTRCSKSFDKLFPNVYAVITELKRKDYTALAKLLQRVESAFVINGVVRRCMNEHPEMPVFTIHDSIMTTGEWVGKLRGIILEEFSRLGISPKLNVD